MFKSKIHIRKQDGVALMLVLVISAIVLVIMTSMIYLITSSTKISGLGKRYSTALEAGQGGEKITEALISARGRLDPDFITAINYTNSPSSCIQDKLTKDTIQWGSGCDTNAVINPGDNSTYDFTFDMGDYRVYGKIIFTIQGNSAGGAGTLGSGGAGGAGGGASGGWIKSGSTYFSGQSALAANVGSGGAAGSGSGGEISVVQIPYYYQIELDTRNTRNAAERARLSLLYQY